MKSDVKSRRSACLPALAAAFVLSCALLAVSFGTAHSENTAAADEITRMTPVEILDRMAEEAPDDVTFIKKIYKMLLNRGASDREMTLWIGQLNKGAGRRGVIDALTTGDEYYSKHDMTGSVAVNNARLMQKPSGESTSVATLKAGTELKVKSLSGGWYYVRLESGQAGYLSRENVNVGIEVFKKWLDEKIPAGEGALAGKSYFEGMLGSEADKIRKVLSKLDECLLKDSKYNYYKLKPAKSIEGEKYLTGFRTLTSDFVVKSEAFNSKNPVKQRIAKLDIVSREDLASYKLLKNIVELQLSNINAVAVNVFKDGKSLIPFEPFSPMLDEKSARAVLEVFKEETTFRKMKRYAVVDLLNFGPEVFEKRNELFMKNAFGQYSNAVNKDLYFVDYSNPRALETMTRYLDKIIDSGYFDAVIIDRFGLPPHPESSSDIRAIFTFNETIVRDFEKNTGLSISSLNESQEMIFKNFAILKFGNFVSELRKYFSKKRTAFLAICDADYYDRKFDARLCEFKSWGNNLDALFLRYPAAGAAALIEKNGADFSKSVSKTQIIAIKNSEKLKFMDELREINKKVQVVKGVFFE